MKAYTLNGYKRVLHAVWFYAYENGDNNNPPLRLRKIREPSLVVEAFTHEEIRKMVDAAKALEGFYPNGVRRTDFWQAAILSATTPACGVATW
jgi:hypothetical protein